MAAAANFFTPPRRVGLGILIIMVPALATFLQRVTPLLITKEDGAQKTEIQEMTHYTTTDGTALMI